MRTIPDLTDTQKQEIETRIRHWIKTSVIGFGLCPFARKEFEEENIRYSVCDTQSEEELLMALAAELELLESNVSIETSLLIITKQLQNFSDYCRFIELANDLIKHLDRRESYQIASFHPNYRFADTKTDAAENFTNRSPFPLLHLLREASISVAAESHPDLLSIPRQNIEKMNNLGTEKLIDIFNKL